MQTKLKGLGITSFADLAAADAQKLTDELKATQRTLTKERLEGWMEEAKKRA